MLSRQLGRDVSKSFAVVVTNDLHTHARTFVDKAKSWETLPAAEKH